MVRYSKAQYDQMIDEGLITAEQGAKLQEQGKIKVGGTGAQPKQKEFHSEEHKEFYDAAQKMKQAIEPAFKKAVLENPAYVEFIEEWGTHKDEKGNEFEISAQLYFSGLQKADRAYQPA